MASNIVLIVDDNSVNLELYGDLVEMTEFQAILLDQPQQAVDIACRERPGLILLDLNLPMLSGQDLAQMLRLQPDLAKVPIVAVTAMCRDGLAEQLRAGGFNGLVAKPCGIETFLAVIRWGMQGAADDFRVFHG